MADDERDWEDLHPDDASDGDSAQDVVSRREAIKMLGIGVGAVWAPPTVTGFFAQVTPGTPPPDLPPEHPECREATCGSFTTCSSTNSDCICVTTPFGGFCIPGSTACAPLDVCGEGFTCPPGHVCAIDTCCLDPVCVPISLIENCPTEEADVTARAAQATREPTGAGTLGG